MVACAAMVFASVLSYSQEAHVENISQFLGSPTFVNSITVLMVALVWRTPLGTQATVTVQMDMREQTVNPLHAM